MVDSYAGKRYEPERKAYPVTRKFMTRSFVKVYPDTDIWEVMDLFVKHKITGAPVIDRSGRLLGMVSERDCLKLVANTTYDNQLTGGPVSDYMSTNPLTVGPDEGLNAVAQLFLKHPFKRLPVIDRGRLVGVVTRRNVLTVMKKYHRHQQRHLTGVHRR